MYYVGILLYGGIALAENLASSYTPQTILENVFFVHGFDVNNFNVVVPGGWSIATEVGFYAVFPALYLLTRRLTTRQMIALWSTMSLLIAFVELLLITSLKSLGYDVDNNNFGFVYATLLNQLPVFIAGMILFRIKAQVSPAKLFALGISCLLVSISVMNNHSLDTGLDGFIWAITAAVGFVALCLLAQQFQNNLPGLGLITRIGEASYSMYLLHFVVLAAVYRIRGLFGLGSGFGLIDYMASFVMAVAATYAISRVTLRYVERPGIALGKKLAAPKSFG